MLAHRLLGGGSSSLSVSCPSLGSTLIATAHARLWSSFRRRSESPLLAHRETKRQEKVSCLFGSCRLFPGLPPGQLWCANPFRLCSRRQPQSPPCDPTKAGASAPRPRPSRQVSRQASRAGECCQSSFYPAVQRSPMGEFSVILQVVVVFVLLFCCVYKME